MAKRAPSSSQSGRAAKRAAAVRAFDNPAAVAEALQAPPGLLPELWEQVFRNLGVRGVLAITSTTKFYTGVGNQQAAETFTRIWMHLCFETFKCRLREMEGKDGTPRILRNFYRHWEEHRKAYADRAREARYEKFTIYQAFWPRVYRATSLFFHLLLSPLRIRFRWARQIQFSGGLKFTDDPEAAFSDLGETEQRTQSLDARPPLPRVNDYGIDLPSEVIHGRGVAISDYPTDVHIRHKYEALNEQLGHITTGHSETYMLELPASLLHPIRAPNFFTLLGEWSDEKDVALGLPLLAFDITTVVMGEEFRSIRVEAPQFWPANRNQLIQIDVRHPSYAQAHPGGPSCEIHGEIDGTPDSYGTVYEAVGTWADKFAGIWAHKAVFRATLISWSQAPPHDRFLLEHRGALVADLLDIETIWRLAPGMVTDVFDEVELVVQDLGALYNANPHDFPALAGASPAELEEAALMTQSAISAADFNLYSPVAAVEEYPDISRHSACQRLQPGLMMIFQLGWLPYERFKKLAAANWSISGPEGRAANTLDELLSTDWPGYHENYDCLLKPAPDDGGGNRKVPYYFRQPVL